MTDLLTPEDLAEKFGTTPRQILMWRRQYGWPSVQVGRKVRFRPEDFELILARHWRAPRKDDDSPAVVVAGQTARSARRAS